MTPKETGKGTRRKHPGRGTSERPEVAPRILARALRAGDMGCALLTVAMAAEENRMTCADPDEAARILAFLARLAEHDAALPVPPGGLGVGPERPTPEQSAATLG